MPAGIEQDRFSAFNPCMAHDHPALDVAALRWQCEPSTFSFATTAEVEPLRGVVGQDDAIEALTFGLEIDAPGQNIYVRGLTGTGRSTLLRRMLADIKPACPLAQDRCYVHNFDSPDRPRLLTLPRGRGRAFRDRMAAFITFVRKDLATAVASDVIKARGKEIERQTQAHIEALTRPFETELRAAGLAMVMVQAGPVSRQMILPLVDGEPTPWEHMDAQVAEGKLEAEVLDALKEQGRTFTDTMESIGAEVAGIQTAMQKRMRSLLQDEARAILQQIHGEILEAAGGGDDLRAWLDAVAADVIDNRLTQLGEPGAFTEQYRVNLIQGHEEEEPCPIIQESAPSVQSLLGTIDRSVGAEAAMQAPHMLVHGGSMLRADGGYLLLEARDVLTEAGAWRALVRTLRSGKIEMVAPDGPVTWRVPPIKPEPIPVKLKVILVGDAGLYYALDGMDADFPNLFKVLVDFEDSLPRDETGKGFYAGVLAHLARDEGLAPFDRTAVAALCEHGVRIAGRRGRLTARFGRLADLAREAAYLAAKDGSAQVDGEHVRKAVQRTKRRANLPSRRFQQSVRDGSLLIRTQGVHLGQVNGLAVIQAGPLTYGFPSRITCSIGPGRRGTINVEDEAEMSGRIHTKGFQILDGLMRNLLRTDHPLGFDASIAFEQSYGGIDGDSASGAEICCLLSALADRPIRQDLAMTGAIDQHGNIQPIGAVNEKIEGFFDVCAAEGLTGTQGVIVPQANVADLMLRQDVVDACAAGTFAVYGVDRIEQALAIFFDEHPGVRGDDGKFPADSLFAAARGRARHFFEMANTARM